MRYLLSFLLAGLLAASCGSADNSESGHQHSAAANSAVASDPASLTTIQWLDSTHQDLGKINEGQVAEISWRFKNTGTKPLVIANVAAGCGCTVAEKPEEPIAPGAEGTIRAKFDSHGRTGAQNKDVTVQANTGDPLYRLTFALEVLKK